MEAAEKPIHDCPSAQLEVLDPHQCGWINVLRFLHADGH
jgi:hypothetical protein